MKITEHLQKLDMLIVEHTKPPVTSLLRNQLSLITEQFEAYQVASDKQDHTLATQIETIERLLKENQELNAKVTNTNQAGWDELHKKSDNYIKMIQSKQLKGL